MAATIRIARFLAYMLAPVKSGDHGLLVPRWRSWSGNFGHRAMLGLYLAMIVGGLALVAASISGLLALIIWNS